MAEKIVFKFDNHPEIELVKPFTYIDQILRNGIYYSRLNTHDSFYSIKSKNNKLMELFKINIGEVGIQIGEWKQFNENGQTIFLSPRSDGFLDFVEMYEDAKSVKEMYTIKAEVSYYIEIFTIDIASLDYMFIKKVLAHTSFYRNGKIKSIVHYD
jgi:antitoxin component YwqK of YwqJK toxin-antitoxin module